MTGDNLSQNLDDPKIWKDQGDQQFLAGDYESAASFYAHAIEINPDYIEALNNFGLTLIKQGKIEEAKKCNEKIKKIKSHSEDSLKIEKNTSNFNISQYSKLAIILLFSLIFLFIALADSYKTSLSSSAWTLIVGLGFGIFIGAIPLFYGALKSNLSIAIIGFILCLAAGLESWFIFSIPIAGVFLYLIHINYRL